MVLHLPGPQASTEANNRRREQRAHNLGRTVLALTDVHGTSNSAAANFTGTSNAANDNFTGTVNTATANSTGTSNAASSNSTGTSAAAALFYPWWPIPSNSASSDNSSSQKHTILAPG